MNAKQRVYNRLQGLEVDRVPNLDLVMQFASKYINKSYDKYCTDYRYLVEGNIKCCEKFGIDMVSAISDPAREVADLGGKIILKYDEVPSAGEPIISEYSMLNNLKLINPQSSKRMGDRVKAIELYHSTVGNEYPILGWIEGPLALGADLRGINDIMIDLIDEPEFTQELLEFTLEQGKMFAKAQVEAGADFIGVGDAAASLIGPMLYEEIALPYEKRLIEYIHSLGAKVKLHICGNTTQILDLMTQTNCDIVDIDWMVNLDSAVNVFKGKASVSGNYDPVKMLLQGSPKFVVSEVKRCIEQGDETTFVSAGCEVPKSTPIENLKLAYQIRKEYTK